jgi:hypothetical protein
LVRLAHQCAEFNARDASLWGTKSVPTPAVTAWPIPEILPERGVIDEDTALGRRFLHAAPAQRMGRLHQRTRTSAISDGWCSRSSALRGTSIVDFFAISFIRAAQQSRAIAAELFLQWGNYESLASNSFAK